MPHRQLFQVRPEEWEPFLFEDAHTPLAIVSADDRFVSCNNAYCRLLGYARSELIGTRWQDYTHKTDIAGDQDGTKDIQSGSRSYSVDKRYHRKDGSTVWVSLYVEAIRADGKFVAYFVTANPVLKVAASQSGSVIVEWIKANPKDAAIIGGSLAYFLGHERLFELLSRLIP